MVSLFKDTLSKFKIVEATYNERWPTFILLMDSKLTENSVENWQTETNTSEDTQEGLQANIFKATLVAVTLFLSLF